jgi:hypothetical protein
VRRRDELDAESQRLLDARARELEVEVERCWGERRTELDERAAQLVAREAEVQAAAERAADLEAQLRARADQRSPGTHGHQDSPPGAAGEPPVVDVRAPNGSGGAGDAERIRAAAESAAQQRAAEIRAHVEAELVELEAERDRLRDEVRIIRTGLDGNHSA